MPTVEVSNADEVIIPEGLIEFANIQLVDCKKVIFTERLGDV